MVLEIKIASVKSITNNALCGGLKLLFDCDSISKSTKAESVSEHDIRRRSARKIIHKLCMFFEKHSKSMTMIFQINQIAKTSVRQHRKKRTDRKRGEWSG